MQTDITGFIFNVQRFSIHDGPGIRTTVFMKGCPLRCFWCHNPEGLHLRPEVQFFPERCIFCGECIVNCEHGGHEFSLDGNQSASEHLYHRENCVSCGECASGCCAEALQMSGEEVTASYVVAEALRDRMFYETSGGGVTLSGGEPLLQREFSRAILQGLRLEEIHTAIETTAFFPWETLAELLPLVDLVMMDIKHMDSDLHKQATGVPNQRILANARRLAESGKPLLLRTPVIPTVNATHHEIGAIAAFIRELNQLRPTGASPITLELLPFHRMAGDKYRSLGMEYQAAVLEPPTREHLNALLETARSFVPDAICR
jgi:pyruvate formate lyase activating enzyme